MKLTAEIIENAAQYTNTITRDRELDLRNYKISVLENLGVTLDQYDCIDFSDNDIRKLDGFPLLNRIKKLLLNNNRITRISEQLNEQLPNLEWLILTNNQIQELGDLDCLSKFNKLECLSLLNNPVTTKKYYRLYIVNKLPHVRLLDFRKIKLKERQEAEQLFKGKKGKQLEKEIGIKSKAFIPANAIDELRISGQNHALSSGKPVHTPADVEAIKAAIAKAQTLEEVERLNQMLKAGYIPGKNDRQQQNTNSNIEEFDDENME